METKKTWIAPEVVEIEINNSNGTGGDTITIGTKS